MFWNLAMGVSSSGTTVSPRRSFRATRDEYNRRRACNRRAAMRDVAGLLRYKDEPGIKEA